MKKFEGILIATTNLAANLDAAFERRFLYKIKFENPSAQAKTAIWQEKLNWLSCDEAEQLAVAYDFSGGEIDNIVRKVAMEEIISGKKSFACRNRSNVQNGKIEYKKRKKNWICVIAILNINVILNETKNFKNIFPLSLFEREVLYNKIEYGENEDGKRSFWLWRNLGATYARRL